LTPLIPKKGSRSVEIKKTVSMRVEGQKNQSFFVLPGSSTFLDFFFFFLGGSSGGNIYRVGDSSVAPIMTDENVRWVSFLWDLMAWIVLFRWRGQKKF